MDSVQLSQANQIYISKQNKQSTPNTVSLPNSATSKPNLTQDTVELSTKTNSNKKKAVIIGIIATSAAIISGLLIKKKLDVSKAKKLAEFIEFKPAQTMDEAIGFAKKNFGIETFDFKDDLELANWANEGFTNLSNKAKGKIHMPKSIYLSELEGTTEADIDMSGVIRINQNAFDTEKNMEAVNTLFKQMDSGVIPSSFVIAKESVLELFKAYKLKKANPNYEFSRMEARKLATLIEDITCPFNEPITVFQAISQDENFTKALKKYDIDLNLEEFSKLTEKGQSEYLAGIFSKIDLADLKDTSLYPRRQYSEFDILYHEMGHLQHHKNTSLFSQLFGKLSDEPKQVAKFTQNPQMQKTASKVSWYAQTKPKEFVAETFAKLCNGVKLPDDVMELYKKFGGVVI